MWYVRTNVPRSCAHIITAVLSLPEDSWGLQLENGKYAVTVRAAGFEVPKIGDYWLAAPTYEKSHYLPKDAFERDYIPVADDEFIARQREFENQWMTATSEFLKALDSYEWPGGQDNLNILAQRVCDLGLVESADKVGALRLAFTELKQEGKLRAVGGSRPALIV